ncbi:MAG: Tat pathway signal protein [Pseudomonadota bacterium]
MISRRTLLMATGAGALAGAGWLIWTAQRPTYDEVVREVWRHRSPDQGGLMSYLVHYATLAANSHNTQPWRFAESGNLITLSANMARATPAADPDFHHLYASLGCAVENLRLAAGAAGQAAEISFSAAENGQVQIALASSRAPRDPLFDAILERQCSRGLYDGRTVPPRELADLTASAKEAGGRALVIEDKAVIEQILELSIEANTRQINDATFREELKSWLRFSGAHAAESRDGLYGPCAGNPAMPSFLGDLVFDFAFGAEAENDKLAEQVRSSAGLMVFISDADDKAHWVQSGRGYQRFALHATAFGVRHAFVNQPVDVPEVRAQLSELLGLRSARPDLMVRFGYGKAMPKSLRRPVNAVIAQGSAS